MLTLDDFTKKIVDGIRHDVNIGRDNTKNELLGIAFDVTYNNFISNTHSAPKNGVENFMCKKELPKGYPGFSGRVWYRTKNEHNPKNTFKKFPTGCLHTGTGGYGSYDSKLWNEFYIYNHHHGEKSDRPFIYSYDCKIFTDDFPEFEEFFTIEIKGEEVMAALGNRSPKLFHIKYEWFDEETKQKDLEFINKYKK